MHNRSWYFAPFVSIALLAMALCLSGCKQNANAPHREEAAPEQAPVLPPGPGASPSIGTPPNEAAGVAWTVPVGWEVEPARQMRIATYRIHAIAGDPEDAECAVYFFGSGQGGSVEANLERWAHQFTSADGNSTAPSKMETREIAGLKVSVLNVSGTYLGAGNMMGGSEPAKQPKFSMHAAIVEAPQGLVFFKLIGPLNTVASADSGFNSLLNSVHRQ